MREGFRRRNRPAWRRQVSAEGVCHLGRVAHMSADPRERDGTLDMFSLANAKTRTAMPSILLAVRVSSRGI
jgi:hypothetical protein